VSCVAFHLLLLKKLKNKIKEADDEGESEGRFYFQIEERERVCLSLEEL
jgi:hypothetical protein